MTLCNIILNNPIAFGSTSVVYKQNGKVIKDVYPVSPYDYGLRRSMNEYKNDTILSWKRSPFIQTSIGKSICINNGKPRVRYMYKLLEDTDHNIIDKSEIEYIVKCVCKALFLITSAGITYNDLHFGNLMINRIDPKKINIDTGGRDYVYTLIDLGRSRKRPSRETKPDVLYCLLMEMFSSIVEQEEIDKLDENLVRERYIKYTDRKESILHPYIKKMVQEWLVMESRKCLNKYQKIFKESFSPKRLAKIIKNIE